MTQHRNLICAALISQTKKNYTTVHLPIPVDLLAEIFIVRDQNTSFCNSSTQNLIVFDSGGLIIDRKHIMALTLEPASYGRTSTLIDEESHSATSGMKLDCESVSVAKSRQA